MRTFCSAVSAVNGGSGGRFIFSSCVTYFTAQKTPSATASGCKSVPALLARGHAVPGQHVGDLLVAFAGQRGPEPGLADAVFLTDPQRLVLEPRQQRRHAVGHASVDPQFVDHGTSPE